MRRRLARAGTRSVSHVPLSVQLYEWNSINGNLISHWTGPNGQQGRALVRALCVRRHELRRYSPRTLVVRSSGQHQHRERHR
jgi:hypothetical protein